MWSKKKNQNSRGTVLILNSIELGAPPPLTVTASSSSIHLLLRSLSGKWFFLVDGSWQQTLATRQTTTSLWILGAWWMNRIARLLPSLPLPLFFFFLLIAWLMSNDPMIDWFSHTLSFAHSSPPKIFLKSPINTGKVYLWLASQKDPNFLSKPNHSLLALMPP